MANKYLFAEHGAACRTVFSFFLIAMLHSLQGCGSKPPVNKPDSFVIQLNRPDHAGTVQSVFTLEPAIKTEAIIGTLSEHLNRSLTSCEKSTGSTEWEPVGISYRAEAWTVDASLRTPSPFSRCIAEEISSFWTKLQLTNTLQAQAIITRYAPSATGSL